MNGRAYYNEIDPYAAQWLRNLIEAGLIAPGDVDTRSIIDVRASDVAGYTQCHFFAGLGGWSGALRIAGWPDDRAVWTGSCPCQPFSLAGKQLGQKDPRHLWPAFRRLINRGAPAVVFGEQVASATNWLRFVRRNLETMGYAVGTMPIEAASAGADHLRDRFWFVADGKRERRAARRSSDARHEGRSTFPQQSGVGLADTYDARSQGRIVLPECAGERIARPDGVANAEREGPFPGTHGGIHREQEGAGARHVDAERRGASCDHTEAMGDAHGARRNGTRQSGEAVPESEAIERSIGRSAGDYEWVIGADGKARRVKPGIRLLAHGVRARVAKLRALGNAIDLRPAAQFIIAATEAIGDAAE